MKLFVGLGNPGSGYARHRHNVGFMALDRIAAQHGFGPWKKRFHGLVADGPIGGRRVVLLKPQTYMNDSGQAVGEAQRYLKIGERDIYVFHDEIDLAPSKLKVKVGGGNAGHNGLRSISAHIGNEYARVRIGVGHPGSKDLVSHHVLHDFAKSDAAWLEPLLDAIADAAGRLASGDAARFLTDVARDLQSDGQSDNNQADSQTGKQAASQTDSQTDSQTGKAQTGAPASSAASRAPAPQSDHPAGERQTKRGSALAENLKRWLRGRSQET
jgi:PTH1 family peptidyl-tRNA hydrolase